MEQFLRNFQRILNIELILDWLQKHFVFLLIGVLIILFYRKIYDFIFGILDRSILTKMKEAGIRSFIKSVVKISIHIFLIYTIIVLFGFNFASVFGILGALSVILGFAFKETINNILGGVILLLFKPFKVHDVIQFDNYIGVVTKIEMFYTRLINFQNEMVIVPNGILVSTEVKNLTVKNKRRLDLVIGVDYKSDIQKVKEILTSVVQECEYVLKDEKMTIGLGELAASSLNFITNVYVLPENYLASKIYILETVKARFDQEGISIPFNQLDVFIKNKNAEDA